MTEGRKGFERLWTWLEGINSCLYCSGIWLVPIECISVEEIRLIESGRKLNVSFVF